MKTDTKTRIAAKIEETLANTAPGQVQPLIVTRHVGSGVLTAMREIGDETTGFDMLEIRCAAMLPYDFTPLPVLQGGEIVKVEPSLASLRQKLESGNDLVVVLDEAVTTGVEASVALIQQAIREAKGKVVVVLSVLDSQRGDAIEAVALGFGPRSEQGGDKVIPVYQPTRQELLDDFIAYARGRGLHEDVLKFLQAEGLPDGTTLRGWGQLGSLMNSPAYEQTDQATRDVMITGLLGDGAIPAMKAWRGFLERRA